LASKLMGYTNSGKPIEPSSPQAQKAAPIADAPVAKSAPPAAKATPVNTSVLPFASFYKVNFKQIKEQGFQSIYDKFPKAKAPQSSQKSSPAAVPIHHKPSVGTWVKPLPKYVAGVKVNYSSAPSPAPTVKDKEAARVEWATKPSVGTWLKPFTRKSAATAPAPPAARPAQVGGPTKDWALKPSAGTWVARPIKINQAAIQRSKAQWVLKPSVGTWLAPRFVEEEVVEEEPRAMVLTTQVMMGPSFYGMGLRPMMAFI